jgi:hypoxanthine phosphoribosyltransferase
VRNPGPNFEIVYTQNQINQMVKKIASEVDSFFSPDEPLVCVGVLKGAWIFHSDLVRQLTREVYVDFIRASSYGHGTQTSGVVRILKDIEVDIRGKNILLIEEIVDSGRTLSFIKKRLEDGGAKQVKIAALLDKRERREVECTPDFLGAIVPDHFVVGYGLDWAENYRNLSEIYRVIDTSKKG